MKTFDGKSLIIVFENGMDVEGNPIYYKKSIHNIKQTAIDTDLFTIASKLAVLSMNALYEVNVDEDYELTA